MPKMCYLFSLTERGLFPIDNKRAPLGLFWYGAGAKNRTRDLLITSQLLYQLSYTGY